MTIEEKPSVILARIDIDEFNKIKAKCLSTPFVDSDTSVLQAGFKLGVQHALAVMREVIVIESR